MLKTLQNALKVDAVRKKLLYTFLMLIVVRFGSQLPVPGVDRSFFSSFFASNKGDAFNFFNAITGGSFEQFSVFALSISPYITSSIIMQLLTIAIPKLEEIQRDGEDGRKKIAEYTRYVTIVLALIQAIAIAIGFGGRGLLTNFNWQSVCVVVLTLTAGSAFLMWIGERITEKGIGNGISIILLINILSGIPTDFSVLYNKFIKGQGVAMGVLAGVIIIVLVIAIITFVVLLNGGIRKIPVQYSQKMQGRRAIGGQQSHIPLKVNIAGVIPVIFASTLMTTPVVISQLFSVNQDSIGGKILKALTSSHWFNREEPIYTIGLILYIVLIVAFAYFYTSITFNPLEIANNMKKQGGFIPGIRPGKPTSDYLNKILNYIVFIGAVGLIIVAIIPIFFSGWFSIGSLSFGGTSLIIIVSVILETTKQIESQMLVRNYKGFLND